MKIKLKINGKNLIYSVIVLSFFAQMLKYFNLDALSYFIDVLNVLAFLFALKKFPFGRKDSLKRSLLLIAVLVIFDFIELLIWQTPILLFLWGIRNQYRFIIFFVSCTILLNFSGLENITKILRRFFYLDFVVVIIEFILGYKQDLNSGIFGIGLGTNGPHVIFLYFCFILFTVLYLSRRIDTKEYIIKLVMILISAAIGELKVLFIILFMAIFLTFIFYKGSFYKKISSLIIGMVGIFCGFFLFKIIFPNNIFSSLNLENIIFYSANINLGAGGFGRFSAIPITTERMFNYDLKRILFGIGIGNAEWSVPFGIGNSQFYNVYSRYMYNCYYDAIVYIERGVFGLIWFSLFFLNSAFVSMKNLKESDADFKIYYIISFVFILSLFVFAIYDDSLRKVSSGYLSYLILAVPFIISKTKKNTLK